MKQPKVERRPLCPLAGFAECRGERCMIWNDDWQICSLNNGSLYSMVRAAVCDAAVEIAGAGGLPQSASQTAPSERATPSDPLRGPAPSEREPLGAVIEA